MQKGSATPTPTPVGLPTNSHNIQFSGFIFEVQIFSDQQISISFNEITASKVHETGVVDLRNINSKTVIAGLKKEHSSFLKATLSPVEDSYILTFDVKYDFLPPIEEALRFTGRKVGDSEMSELEIKNYFHEIKDLTNKINEIANCKTYCQELKDGKDEKDLVVPMPESRSLITWSIHAKQTNNTIKLQIYYLNSHSRNEKKSKLVPNDAISVYAPHSSASADMRFLVEPVEGFDKLVFRVESSIKGKQIVVSEKI